MSSIEQIAKQILNYLWIVFLTTIITTGIFGYWTLFKIVPTYESTTSIYVLNKSSGDAGNGSVSYNDILASQLLVKNYIELIKSKVVTNQVIQELNLYEIDSTTLAENINVELKGESNILKISVVYKDPQNAKLLADKVSEIFVQQATGIMEGQTITLVDRAEVSNTPVGPRNSLLIAIGVISGFILGLLIVLTIIFLDDRIRSVEDVEEKLNIQIVGIIPNLDIK